MGRRDSLIAALLLACAGCHPGTELIREPEDQTQETNTVTHRASLQARFQDELDQIATELKLPGATAAYALPDGTVGVAAAGFSDLEQRTPMTAQSRMLAASIGKSFVAATALALAQEGALDLDAPIATILSERPWFARLANHDTITTRHLLTHTSGLPDHVHRPEFAHAVAQHWQDPAPAFPPEALVGYVLDVPALFPAGQGWAYTDTGYILVGLIIEHVTGGRYEEEVQHRFLAPLALDATTPSNRRTLPRLAAGYTAPDNPLGLPAKTTTAPGVMAWDPAIEWAGGGLASTPGDLARWARALYEGRALPSSAMANLMRSVAVGGEDSGVRYGAGVALHQETTLGPSYGHGGTIPGYVSSMRYYPEHRIAVAFQVNTDVEVGEAVPDIERRLAELVVHAVVKK